jgi:hypothetical protein
MSTSAKGSIASRMGGRVATRITHPGTQKDLTFLERAGMSAGSSGSLGVRPMNDTISDESRQPQLTKNTNEGKPWLLPVIGVLVLLILAK